MFPLCCWLLAFLFATRCSKVEFDVLWLDPVEGTERISYNHVNKLAINVLNMQDEEPVKVISIDGSLRRYDDYSRVLQNLSSMRTSTLVGLREQATFEYRFGVADPYSATVKAPVGLVVSLRYVTGNEVLEADVFNETIIFQDDYSTFDVQFVFMVVVLAGIFIGLAYLAVGSLAPKSARKLLSRSSEVNSASDATSPYVDVNWISPENLKTFEAMNKRTDDGELRKRS